MVLILGFSAFFYFTKEKANTEKASSVVDEKIIPETTPLITIGGERKTFREYRGKLVLVNFWASWCAPCIREMPSIYKIYAKLKGRGFSVLAINMDDNPEEGNAFLKRKIGVPPFDMFKGIDSEILSLFPIQGLPHSAIIDRNGKIVYSKPGEENWASKEMEKLLEGFL